MDKRWTTFEKKYNNTFDKHNPYCYLFSDACFLKKVEDFKPERQWEVVCGKLFKEDDHRRYFCSIETKKDFLINIFVPTNTFYDQFYIYDHDYLENESIEIFWRDMLYTFSFNDIKNQDLESRGKYMGTRGIILKQNETHILLEVEKYIISSKSHRVMKDQYKYMSIPKSYIRNFRKVGKEWQEAKLKKLTPKLDPIITESKINLIRIRKEVEEFSNKYKDKKSFLPFQNPKTNKKEYGVFFSYDYFDFGMKYVGKIGGIFTIFKKKFLLKRLSKDVYKAI